MELVKNVVVIIGQSSQRHTKVVGWRFLFMVKPKNLAIWSEILVYVFFFTIMFHIIYVLFMKMREVFGYHSLEAFLFQLAETTKSFIQLHQDG